MAWEMSPMRAPGPAAAIPARSARSVALDQRDALRRLRVADDEADGGVGDDSVQGDGEVERQQVAVGERVVVRQPVQHGVVDRRADVVAERPAAEGRRVVDVAGLRAGLDDHAPGPTRSMSSRFVPTALRLFSGLQDVGDQGAGGPGPGQVGGVQDLDHAAPSSRDPITIPAMLSRY